MDGHNTYIITLRNSARYPDTAKHFAEMGLVFRPFYGINGVKMGLMTAHTYESDRPNTGERISSKHIGCFLSHYMLWQMLSAKGWPVSFVFEDDCRFHADWHERLESAREALPDNWDMVLLGSCCCQGRPTAQIGNNLFRVEYPLCTHGYMVSKQGLEKLLDTQTRCWANIDAALFYDSYPSMNVFTILPRICEQSELPNLAP